MTPEQVQSLAHQASTYACQALLSNERWQEVRDQKFAELVEQTLKIEVPERLFWEACQPHGKVGELVFMTYKAKRGAAPRPAGHDITGDRNVDHPV